MSSEEINAQIKELESRLTGNMFKDMDLKDEIHKLNMALNGIKPEDSAFECVGCGS